MDDHPALRLLQSDEWIEVQAPAGDALVGVTDRRLAVANAERLMLDVPIEGLRRIQFGHRTQAAGNARHRARRAGVRPTGPRDRAIGHLDIARALVTVGLWFAEASDGQQTS